jgi:mono/diheme cytochrome c family protein
MRNTLTLLAVALLALTLGASAAAQSPPAPSAPPKVAIVEARTFGVIEGAKLYEIYCASCHGQDGKGNGPAARALPRPVPDLTQISATHPGTDCFLHVMADLQGGHRSDSQPKVSEKDLDMPNWGPVLRSASAGDPSVAYLRLANVARHISTLQKQ